MFNLMHHCPTAILLLLSIEIAGLTGCKTQRPDPQPTSNLSASEAPDEVLGYIVTYTGNDSEDFKSKVRKYFRNFNLTRAVDLFTILEARIGKQNFVAKLVKSPSAFIPFFPDRLHELLNYLDDYWGSEHVNARLAKGLVGFHSKTEDVKSIVAVLQGYIDDDQIKKRMAASFVPFGATSGAKLRPVLQLVESYIGHAELAYRLKKDLQGFASTDAPKLILVTEIMSRYLDHGEIAARMMEDMIGFGQSNPYNFEDTLDFLSRFFSRAEIRDLLMYSHSLITLADPTLLAMHFKDAGGENLSQAEQKSLILMLLSQRRLRAGGVCQDLNAAVKGAL